MEAEIEHQLNVIHRALARLNEWVKPGQANIYIMLNDIEKEIYELRKLFEQTIKE